MSTLSPNMNLVLPTIGIDSGLIWEQAVNTNSGILDGHNHSIGSGVQINPGGININADLPFNGFNAISLRSTRYTEQIAPISLPTDIGCLYVSGVDLYYNDINGNIVQITSGGTVNATSSGISSGTNTASFSSSTLVVNAASNTPANIQGASILIGNTGVSGSKFITLSPPSAIPANYNLQLPPLPAQTNVMTLDTSGNMNSITYDQVGVNMTSVGADAIAASMDATGADDIGVTMTASGANAIAASITRSTGSSTEGIGGIAVSASSGSFTGSSTSYAVVTNLSVTLTTSGRPVQILMTPDTSSTGCFITATGSANIACFAASTLVGNYNADTATGGGASSLNFPIAFVSFPAAGSTTFTIQYKVSFGTNVSIDNWILIAYEL
jgi:hypothetical protein